MRLNFETLLFLLIVITWYAFCTAFKINAEFDLISIIGFGILISLASEINKKLNK